MEEQSAGVSNERGNNLSGTRPLIWWFALALVPLAASQVMRLHQHQAAGWLAWDYAGRVTALAILGAVPSARAAAFRTSKRQISLLRIALWIVGICLLDRFLRCPRRLTADAAA
jgi:CAAX protease family protein